VGNVADAGKCFASETICANRGQVIECFQLGGGKSLAEKRQVVSLEREVSQVLLDNDISMSDNPDSALRSKVIQNQNGLLT
jgi:hypothetical protein